MNKDEAQFDFLAGEPHPSSGRAADSGRREAGLATDELILKRRNHPAWLLLASPRAPLVLGCLQPLFDRGESEIPLEETRLRLSHLLSAHANDPSYKIDSEDFAGLARKELREWIKKGLLAERAGKVFATDALQSAFRFIEGLQERIMTSTASRLATVQQRIESLEARMDPDKERRKRYLEEQIDQLKAELQRVERNEFEVLDGVRAAEEMREVYALATSLRADFRRVEDSYREADHNLRQSIISSEHNRGEVVDRLLQTNRRLLDTAEGQVFAGFCEQIARGNEIDKMRHRLRRLLALPEAAGALTAKQTDELRTLITRLIDESQHVMQARARSEKDVRSFIKTGLAGEHHRVGRLLREILETALEVNWSRQALRRTPGPLHPTAPAQQSLPLPERLEPKSMEDAEQAALNLEKQEGNLDALAQSFAENCDELDRSELYERTLRHLRETGNPGSIGALAEALPPKYDLETLNYWVTLAREAGLVFDPERIERVDLEDAVSGSRTRFEFPRVELTVGAVADVDPLILE